MEGEREFQMWTGAFSSAVLLMQFPERLPISLQSQQTGFFPDMMIDSLHPSKSKQLGMKWKIFLSIFQGCPRKSDGILFGKQ